MIPNIKLLIITSLVSFAANWQFGYQITYINTASLTFYKIANYEEINITEEHLKSNRWSTQWSAIVSSFYPGTFIGFIFVPFLTKKIGVKSALLVSTIPAMIGLIIQLVGRIVGRMGETLFVIDLIIGRFLIGIHSGCALCLLPLFIIEFSPQINRPFLSCLQQVFQALATLLGLIIGSNNSISIQYYRFEFLQIAGLIPTLFFVFLLLYLPPTPFRIIDKFPYGSTENELKESIEYYYSNDDVINIDVVKAEAFSRWKITSDQTQTDVLKLKENVKGLLIGVIAAVSYSFTADDIIDSYSTQILLKNGFKKLSESITVGYGFLLFITSVFGAFLIDHFGRKKLIIFGLLGTALFNTFAVIGALIHYPPLEVIGFALTKSAIGFGAGAPAWFLTSELVSPRITHLCQSISTGALLIASGFSTYAYLPFESYFGIYNIVILAIIPAVISALILMIFLPETKNKNYEQIRWNLLMNKCSGLNKNEANELLLTESDPIKRKPKNGLRNYGTNDYTIKVF